MYANLYVNLREGINCYKSLPKHKTITEDLDNIIQDFKTVRLGLKQNRYTALTSINAPTSSWFISAAAVRSFGLFSPCLIEDIFAYKDYNWALFAK